MARSAPIALPDIAVNGNERLPVAMEELSRVLGGGICRFRRPGGRRPRIGKSTLLLQLAAMMARVDARAHVSGEESVQQVKMRAARLGIRSSQLYILAENSLEQILLHLEEMRPAWPSWIRSNRSTWKSWRPLPAASARCASAPTR